jgi:hypothetical protein
MCMSCTSSICSLIGPHVQAVLKSIWLQQQLSPMFLHRVPYQCGYQNKKKRKYLWKNWEYLNTLNFRQPEFFWRWIL